MSDYERWSYMDRMESRMRSRENEQSTLHEEVGRLKDKIRDLQRSYSLAMELIKTASPDALAGVAFVHEPLATQDDLPNTRDLVQAMLQRCTPR